MELLDRPSSTASGNNYLSTKSDDGSARWSDGTLNVSTAITDNFRAGIQVHSYILGQLGRGNLIIDWAYGDYRVKQWLGFRGGIIKAPMGLYNDISDTDTLYNWILLPQGIYEADLRSFNIPVTGGAIYGHIPLPKRGGSLTYQVFGGQRVNATYDGSELMTYQTYGISLGGAMKGYVYGGDMKWETPIPGLTAGVSFDNDRLFAPHATWYNNPFGLPPILAIDSAKSREIYSLDFQHGKLELATEGKHEPHWVANDGVPVGTSPRNAWYVMGSYHLLPKLTLGSYFSRVVGTNYSATTTWPSFDPSNPVYYGNDTITNGRYDINRFVYVKLEGHYIDGELGPFFPGTNPNGLQKITRLIIVRGGFTF